MRLWNWWARRKMRLCHPTHLRVGARRETTATLIPRRDTWRQNRFEVLGAVAVDGGEIFVGDAAQFSASARRHAGGVDLGVLAHDRLDRVDVMGDQLGRDAFEV